MLYAEPWLKILHWQYAPKSGTLCRYDGSGDAIVLEPRLHSLLNFFLQNPEQIVAKEHILNSVWGTDQGTDAALMRAVATLRKLLEDQSKPSLFIETHSRKGYCWIAKVETLAEQTVTESVAQEIVEPQPITTTAEDNTETVNNLLVDIVESRSRQRFATLRYLCISVSAVAILCIVFVFLLWRLGREAYIPSFPYQINISALPGEEIEPVESADRQHWFYWYRSEGSAEWRLIRHETQSHRKIQLAAGFEQVGQLNWFDNKLVFTAVRAQTCGVFLQDPDAPDQTKQIATCQQFVSKGLIAKDHELFWLDQVAGKTQLWGLTQQQQKLLLTLPGVFRQPKQLLVQNHQLYLLVQEYQQSYHLFVWQQDADQPRLSAKFAMEIQSISWWDKDTLLLSGLEKLQLYNLAGQRLMALNTHAGLFADMRRIGDTLLGIVQQNPALDLVPFQQDSGGRHAEISIPQWLTSNRDDWLFAGDGVFLSTRSGLPQIWRYADGHLRQLTKFKTAVSINQLIWQEQNLFAVVDQQLMQVDLGTGELSLTAWSSGTSRRYANCHGQWFWTEQTDSGWGLYQLKQSAAVRLVEDAVDLVCGPNKSLVLQSHNNSKLQRYFLENAKVQPLPIDIDWRSTQADLWGANDQAIYWVDANHHLQQFDWLTNTTKSEALPSTLKPEALYVTAEPKALYLLQRRSQETEVVRLQAMPISEH